MDEVSGSGSAELNDDGTIEIAFAYHLGDASVRALPRFVCVIAQSSGTCSRVVSSSAARQAATASSSRAVSALPLASVRSAMPRFIWVAAQTSGTRSRVRSSSAAR